MEKRFTTDWKIVKRNLVTNGYTYTNHGNIGEFNKDDVLILINKEDPWNLSYIAYMGEEPISLHTPYNHPCLDGVLFIGGLRGSVRQIPDNFSPIKFDRTVYVYLDAAAHKGHGIPRSLARKEMGIE